MEIKRQEHGRKGAFYIEEDGEWVAELTYLRTGDKTMVIDHTEVDPKFRGENIGKDMVAEAVAFARENGLKIEPNCPYAKGVIDATPEFKDILA